MDEDIEKPENWKDKLSPAFNEEEIFYSLLILGNFYVVYATVKANFDAQDNSADDEERFIQSCLCNFNQRFFYRFWVCFCAALWFLIHTYSYIAQLSVKRCRRFRDVLKRFLACCIVCPCYYLGGVCKSCFNSGHKNNSTLDLDKIKLIKKNIKRLWFQYYKLYVIGYTGYDDEIIPIKDIMMESKNGKADSDKSENGLRNKQPQMNTDGNDTCPEANKSLLKDISHVILFIVKYTAQLVTVPLLLLQIFDNYALLCFMPDLYCSNATEYKLHLIQASITLFFYCSLAVSHLASTLVIWNPWPTHNKQHKHAAASSKQSKLKANKKQGTSVINRDQESSSEITDKLLPNDNLSKRPQAGNLVDAINDKFEEVFSDNYPWTIYFLIDLKVVYIITFALITVINLISSTANIHASTDKTSPILFNVSSHYMNVNVTSINDPVLWNCRRFSETSNYYKFLYWMIIITVVVVMGGLLSIKFVSLITVNSCCGCKCCIRMSSTFSHGFTKLWHIAMHEKLVSPDFNLEDIDPDAYDKRLKQKIPEDSVKNLSCYRYFQSVIPYILLFLSVTILCLTYSSFDLHPLACILEPDEELIIYEASKVTFKFSTFLLYYQKIGAISAFTLTIIFLILVKLFFYCTKQVVKELKKCVPDFKKQQQELQQDNEGKMEPFPSDDSTPQGASVMNVNMCCKCRLPFANEDAEMMKCPNCKIQYHYGCVGFTEQTFKELSSCKLEVFQRCENCQKVSRISKYRVSTNGSQDGSSVVSLEQADEQLNGQGMPTDSVGYVQAELHSKPEGNQSETSQPPGDPDPKTSSEAETDMQDYKAAD